MVNTKSLLDAKIVVVALGAAIAALGIALYYGLMMEVRMAESRLDELVHAEADFQREIGYGGLIHNYKNYLVRGVEAYRTAAIDNHSRAMALIARLGDFAPDAPPDAFAPLRETLNAYRANLDVIADAHARGVDPREIDRAVSVSSGRALESLGFCVHQIHLLLAERRDDLIDTQWNIFIAIGTFLAALTLIVLALIGGVRRRMRVLEGEASKPRPAPPHPTKARSMT